MLDGMELMTRDELELLLAEAADEAGQVELALLHVTDPKEKARLVKRLSEVAQAQKRARVRLVLWATL